MMGVPSKFFREEALRALNGNVDALYTAFLWNATEQGQDFWAAERRSGKLSPRARSILQRWVAEDALFADFQPGDRVRALASENPGEEFTRGKEYEVETSNGIYVNVIADDSGDPNGWSARFFELSDRPTEEAA